MGTTEVTPHAPVVFVVDDEPTIAETQAQILRINHYRVFAFTNPLTALSAAAEMTPDLLLSDFHMPQMNGLDLASELQQRVANCKVLMISGAGVLARSHPLVNNYVLLEKPVTPVRLLAHVKAALERG